MRHHLWRACCALLWVLLAASANAQDRITAITAADLQNELRKSQGQVVLLNFWATWCRPCLDEIPLFMELEQEYAAQGFRLVAVSLDELDTLDSQVMPFMQKWFPTFTSFISTEYSMDTMVSVVDQSWNEVLPTSYLLNPDGSVAELLQGKYDKQDFAERIQALLPE